MVNEMRPHVSYGADAPVGPAAPVEGVIDGVVFDGRRRTEKQVPGERVRHRIGPRHGVGQTRHDGRHVPEQFVRTGLHRLRPRNALRPVGERPVCPDTHLAHFAYSAGPHILVHPARIVARVPLIAHLRRQLLLLRFLRQFPHLVDRPGEWLLDVDVLAQSHRGRCDDRVRVVRRGDQHGVDVLLLLEHLAIVLIAFRLRQVLVLEPARSGYLFGDAAAFFVRPGLFQPALLPLDLGPQPVKPLGRVAPIHITQRDDVLAREADEVASPLASHANAGDVQQIARRREAAS